MRDTLSIIGIIGIFILMLILGPLVTMALWNWLMPAIFGLTTISFWQAVGLYILSRTLFGLSGLPFGKIKTNKEED